VFLIGPSEILCPRASSLVCFFFFVCVVFSNPQGSPFISRHLLDEPFFTYVRTLFFFFLTLGLQILFGFELDPFLDLLSSRNSAAFLFSAGWDCFPYSLIPSGTPSESYYPYCFCLCESRPFSVCFKAPPQIPACINVWFLERLAACSFPLQWL